MTNIEIDNTDFMLELKLLIPDGLYYCEQSDMLMRVRGVVYHINLSRKDNEFLGDEQFFSELPSDTQLYITDTGFTEVSPLGLKFNWKFIKN